MKLGDKLKYWLIRKVIGKTPVLANFQFEHLFTAQVRREALIFNNEFAASAGLEVEKR
jgi:hypothetical protein